MKFLITLIPSLAIAASSVGFSTPEPQDLEYSDLEVSITEINEVENLYLPVDDENLVAHPGRCKAVKLTEEQITNLQNKFLDFQDHLVDLISVTKKLKNAQKRVVIAKDSKFEDLEQARDAIKGSVGTIHKAFEGFRKVFYHDVLTKEQQKPMAICEAKRHRKGKRNPH